MTEPSLTPVRVEKALGLLPEIEALDPLRALLVSISRSWTARRIFACSARLMSAISSRNRVPLAACSKRPILRVTAPVNAPFS